MVTVISGWLASVCGSGGGVGGGGEEKRELNSGKAEGREPHLCQACL